MINSIVLFDEINKKVYMKEKIKIFSILTNEKKML